MDETTLEAVESGVGDELRLVTHGVQDEFVRNPPAKTAVLQAGIDDLSLVADVDPRHIERIRAYVIERPTPWGTHPLGLYEGNFGKWRPLFERHRVFVKSDCSRLYVQAKLAPEGRLLPPVLLGDAVSNLERTLAFMGLILAPAQAAVAGMPEVVSEWRVSRIDVAVDLVFRSVSDGKRLLDALHTVSLPRRWYSDQAGDRTPTTYHKLPSGKVGARMYSRHRETGQDPFRVVRLERQCPIKPKLALGGLTPAYVKAVWSSHFDGIVPASRVVTVGSQEAVIMDLLDRVERGELAFGKFEQAVGYLLAERYGAAEAAYPAKRLQERRRLCRELGVRLGDLGVDELQVELGDLVDQCKDAEAWERMS